MSFRAALGTFATGVCVVSTLGPGGAPAGVTVNSFTAVSLDPALVLFCLDRGGQALAAFGPADCWAVHVLGEDQQAIADRFARRRGERESHDPWETLPWQPDANGVPIIEGCLARISCTAERTLDGGDHAILLGRVTRLEMQPSCGPLLYFRGRYEAIAAATQAA